MDRPRLFQTSYIMAADALVMEGARASAVTTWFAINSHNSNPFYKSHNSLDKYPTMHHFVTEMCTHVHISVTKWCIVGYGIGALWDVQQV